MAVTYLMQNQPETGRRWKFGDCVFIEIRRELLVRGQPVKLESKPLEVLQHLLEHPAQVLTKDELIGAAWATSTTDQSLTTAISKLRKAFGGPRDSVILSVSGVGYRMAVPVSCEVVDEVSPPLRLQPGDAVPGRPNWKVVKSLADGGYHSVWLAEHGKTREARVFKFATDGVRLRALQREVTLSRLLRQALSDDAGFVRILDWDFEREPFFIESEYGGLNLFEWSETEEFANLPLAGRIALAAEIVETVASAHALGILHNDLKPANVLVVSTDSGADNGTGPPKSWQIKVADFGVASVSDLQRLVELQITHYGSFENNADGQSGPTTPVGTAMYRAPELLAGAAPSIQGDVYALGVMLYQIVSGDFLETPSVGWESRIADPVLRQDIADAANIDPAHRIASASELAQRLRTLEERRTKMEVRAAEIAAAEQARRAMENARLRRPWLIVAMVALVVGLCASLWFYRNAVRQRDLANSRSETLSAMNDFLTVDLLGQSNPLAAAGLPEPPQQGTQQITLIEAILKASPHIDSRLPKSPATSGQLHEAIAAGLDARTEYAAADREFEIAAQRFREAEGPLSQNVIIAEYRREVVQVRSHNLAAIENAKLGFDHQENLVGNLKTITPELQAWRALAQTSLLINSPHAQQAVPILSAAVHRAETTPGFNPSLLLTLKLRFCAIYLGLTDGANAERAAREAIATIQTIRGPDSPALLQPKLWLQESLILQGKYKETIAEANADYPQFEKMLGPQNLMTLASLEQRAGAEGQLGDYATALRDELALYAAAKSNSSGKYTEEETLSTIATFECRAGHFNDGLQYARQVVRESSAPEAKQPLFVNLGNFAIAECLLSQQEARSDSPAPAELREADLRLKSIDIPVVARTAGLASFPGDFSVAQARLALLRGQTSAAKEFADNAEPIENQPSADPFEKKALAKVEAALAHHSNSAESESDYSRPNNARGNTFDSAGTILTLSGSATVEEASLGQSTEVRDRYSKSPNREKSC